MDRTPDGKLIRAKMLDLCREQRYPNHSHPCRPYKGDIMYRRTSYQRGTVLREKRKRSPDVWIFRWREADLNGQQKRCKRIIGTVQQYPTEAAALRAADAVRTDINQQSTSARSAPATLQQLVEHYQLKELDQEDDQGRKSHATKEAYRLYIKNWILPRWGSYRLAEVKTVAVEDWLGKIPRSRGTKAKIRNIMSAIFNHAIRYEWGQKNPITLVRQSAKREKIPTILEASEIQLLLTVLEPRERTLALLAAGTGLRVGELLALKWSDVDFETLDISVTRSIVHQVVGPCKTEASQKPVPLDGFMAEDLLAWRKTSPYAMEDDWIFASPWMHGEQPYWPESLIKRHIRPAAEKAGIKKHLSWHTFRHTYSTLLRANGEDVKVVQELLRHANSRITLDIYTQAMTPAKRQAQNKIVEMILPQGRRQKSA
jgi:integrase